MRRHDGPRGPVCRCISAVLPACAPRSRRGTCVQARRRGFAPLSWAFSQPKNSPYQRRELRGLSTQWFSSGNHSSRASTLARLERVVVGQALLVGHAVVECAVDHQRGRVHVARRRRAGSVRAPWPGRPSTRRRTRARARCRSRRRTSPSSRSSRRGRHRPGSAPARHGRSSTPPGSRRSCRRRRRRASRRPRAASAAQSVAASMSCSSSWP